MSEPTATTPAPIAAVVEDAGPCRKRLKITVPAERVREEVDRAFLDVIRHARVPGFRPGHLPRKVAEMRYGAEVRDEVKGNLLEKAFGEVVEREGLSPIGAPDLKGAEEALDPEKPFEFEVTLEVRPEFDIPDLKSVSVRRVPAKVEESDVDQAVEGFRLDRAELRPAEDGAVAVRDVIVLDAAVLVEGAEVVSAENVQVRHPSDVVAGIQVPGFSTAVLGKKSGEAVSMPVTLPPHFRDPKHAGKAAELRVTVRDVKRFHMPDLDEAFAKSLDFDSVDELRSEARKFVAREKEAEAEKALDAAILDAILEKAPIPLPEGIVHREIGQVLQRYRADLHMQGAPEEAIEAKLAEIQGDAKEHVEREFRVSFLVDALAKRKGIFVTEGEVAEQVGLMAARYRRPPEEMRRYLEQRDLMAPMRSRLRERKVLDGLRKEVRIES
jgi:trigger factor